MARGEGLTCRVLEMGKLETQIKYLKLLLHDGGFLGRGWVPLCFDGN